MLFPPTSDAYTLLHDMLHWAQSWSAQFDYVASLVALEKYDLAQATCIAIQIAADTTDDTVSFDYAVAIKALCATCVAQQPSVPLVAYDVIVTASHPALN